MQNMSQIVQNMSQIVQRHLRNILLPPLAA